MPFFLVTHTSLVEADDAQLAAEQGISKIRAGAQVTVSVKSDETVIAHIVVAARSGGGREISPVSPPAHDQPLVPVSETRTAKDGNGKPSLKRLIADTFARITRRY